MAFSQLMHSRFQAHLGTRRVIAFIYITVMLVYLGWRATIINSDTLWISLVYYLAECIGFILGLVMILTSWNYRHRVPVKPPEGLSVDVFVTTYKEPVDLVRMTLIGANEIRYPHTTYLLDDGNRPEMKAMAEALGVIYLARGENLHAKAGNLNFGLEHSSGDFIMVFDADHIPMPHAVEQLLGFFNDKEVALAQAPQDFYNTTAFQYMNHKRDGALWHDQSLFYGIGLPCRDYFDGASCIGTSVIYRRSALKAIGNMPTDTLTEDMHTSLLLSKAGYKVVYLNEPLAYGVAAADMHEFYRTRHRWAHGNLHVLSLDGYRKGKLTWGQYLCYLSLGLIYLEGWQQLLLFMVPMVSLFFGLAPFEITPFNVAVVLLFPVFSTLMLQELGCGMSRYWANEIYGMIRFPIQIIAAAGLFRAKPVFRSSSKNLAGRVNWGLLAPQLGVAIASWGALITGIVHLSQHFSIGPLAEAVVSVAQGHADAVTWHKKLNQGYTLDLVAVAGFWAFFNAFKAMYVVRKAIRDARQSTTHYRFDVRLSGEIQHAGISAQPIRIDRISTHWLEAKLYHQGLPAIDTRVPVRLFLPAGPVDATMHVQASNDATHTIEGVITFNEPSSYEALQRCLYTVDWHREYMRQSPYFITPLSRLTNFFTRAPRVEARQWSPATYKDQHQQTTLAIIGHARGAHDSLICFEPLQEKGIITLDVHGSDAIYPCSFRVEAREPVASAAPYGLDKTTMYRYRVQRLRKVAATLQDAEPVELSQKAA